MEVMDRQIVQSQFAALLVHVLLRRRRLHVLQTVNNQDVVVGLRERLVRMLFRRITTDNRA